MDDAERQDLIGAFKVVTDKLHSLESQVAGLKERIDILEIEMDGVLTILEANKPK